MIVIMIFCRVISNMNFGWREFYFFFLIHIKGESCEGAKEDKNLLKAIYSVDASKLLSFSGKRAKKRVTKHFPGKDVNITLGFT